jgi:hypothetical protein
VIQVALLQRKSSSIEAALESLSLFPGRQCSYYINTMVSFVWLVTRYPVLLNLEWFYLFYCKPTESLQNTIILKTAMFNSLNAELNPTCHLIILLGDLTFMGKCLVSISNKMQRYAVYLYLETVLHVSGGTSTHHQERIQLYRQYLVFVTPLLLSAAIVDELEPVWVCCWWRTPQRPLPDNTQHSQQTKVHAADGIRNHNLSRRAAADLRLKPRGHWDPANKLNLGAANRFNTLVGPIVVLPPLLFNLSWYCSASLLFQSRRGSLSQDSYRRILSDSLLRHELQTTPNPFPRQDRVCGVCVLSQISCPFFSI